jgi:hypothetical protein
MMGRMVPIDMKPSSNVYVGLLQGKLRLTTQLAIRQCQKSASSMMIGIGTPSSQRRMPLPMCAPLYWPGGENAIVPRTVAQRAAFDRGQTCGECSE